MSADNILVILHNRGKIRVYDVNFSWVSSLEEWAFPVTREASQTITNLIVNSTHEHELHKCDTESQAAGFCTRYQRENLVEYDHCSIIPQATADEIKTAKIKKKKKAQRSS
jgi:hypothetical protein